MFSVLFVCTGNQFRSPIAAEIFRNQLMQDGRIHEWKVSSAGTWTSNGRKLPVVALELARSFGLDLSRHLTRMIDASILEEADLILVMENGHKESIQVEFPFTRKKVFLLSQVLEGEASEIPDPSKAVDDAKNIIREMIDMIHKGINNIYLLAEGK